MIGAADFVSRPCTDGWDVICGCCSSSPFTSELWYWYLVDRWAASWQNQQNGMCAQRRLRSAWASAQSDQSFAVRMKKAWVLSYPLSAKRKVLSDWADAQADLSLRWAHRQLCWFCHEAAQTALSRKPFYLFIYLFIYYMHILWFQNACIVFVCIYRISLARKWTAGFNKFVLNEFSYGHWKFDGLIW